MDWPRGNFNVEDSFSGDGSTTVFTLTYTPQTGTIFVWVKSAGTGVWVRTTDFTQVGTALTMTNVYLTGDSIKASYQRT